MSSRREFISLAGALGAASFAATSEAVEIDVAATDGGDSWRSSTHYPADIQHSQALRDGAFRARLRAAEEEKQREIPPHPTNGDEERYRNRISVSTKGLEHDALGHVDPQSYDSFVRALRSGRHEDFESIILGGTARLADPQGPLTTALEGATNSQLAIPLDATLDSADLAADHIEIYWQALLRDVPFSEYRDDTSDPLVLAAVSELNRLSAYKGPRSGGAVRPATLFRGTALYVDPADRSGRRGKYTVPPGVLDGPYISQFLLRPIPAWGTVASQAQTRPIQRAGESFGTDFQEWLALRNGISTGRSISLESGRRHVINGRDLATVARSAGPTYLHALQILLTAPVAGNPLAGGIGAPLNPANPYLASLTQSSGSSFSSGFIQGLIALAGPLAIKTSYYQNWYVNRRLRPEDYGGLIHKIKTGAASYPIHQDVLSSDALARTFDTFRSYLLPLANNTGAPTHPGYPSGATISAATPVTLLKAFFDESYVIPNPVQVDPSDPTRLIPYAGAPLTVGGELNKLVSNIGLGRDFNGFHVRSDISASQALGESLAISLLRDQRFTYNEPFSGYRFTRFDGSVVTV